MCELGNSQKPEIGRCSRQEYKARPFVELVEWGSVMA